VADSGKTPQAAGPSVPPMPVDLAAAERFVLANARLIDRRRMAVLLHGAPAAGVLDALRAYRNPDGGFGHALEPDVRAPSSEPAATLHALHVLAEIRALDDAMVADAATWIATVANADGGVPFVLPGAAAAPRAPWMVPAAEGSHLTFGLAAALVAAGARSAWLERALDWCWAVLAKPAELSAYWVKFALELLDVVEDETRAVAAIDDLRALLEADGSLRVPGGTEDERLTPLTLADRPQRRSRRLFTEEQIAADLDRLEAGQADGGWTFDWLAWSPGQSVEWRGIVTLQALATLAAHERLSGGGAAHGRAPGSRPGGAGYQR
jgi:hypothetical protein